MKYRQALIDTFIDRIYLYDDKMTILYNAQDSHSDVDLDEIIENSAECSSAVEVYYHYNFDTTCKRLKPPILSGV